ncbi:MAG TPA: hypothetical protein VK446_09675 [Methylocystis sp.]|nr:hypothetical protein [Methylocystis sp.]
MSVVAQCPEIIDGAAVKGLVESNAVRGATILGQPGGWAVVVRYGAQERIVARRRSREMRLWRSLNAAAGFVRKELRLARFDVDALALNELGEGRADYDAWFRARVREGLDAFERGEILTQEEAEADFARMMDQA